MPIIATRGGRNQKYFVASLQNEFSTKVQSLLWLIR